MLTTKYLLGVPVKDTQPFSGLAGVLQLLCFYYTPSLPYVDRCCIQKENQIFVEDGDAHELTGLLGTAAKKIY